MAQAAKIGDNTAGAVAEVMRRSEHVQQGFNAALGILNLAKVYTPQRLECASLRCIHFRTVTYRALKSVLEKNLDQQPLSGSPVTGKSSHVIMHENLRLDFNQHNNTEKRQS